MFCGCIFFWPVEAAVSGQHFVCVSYTMYLSQCDCRLLSGRSAEELLLFDSVALTQNLDIYSLIAHFSSVTGLGMSRDITLPLSGQLPGGTRNALQNNKKDEEC